MKRRKGVHRMLVKGRITRREGTITREDVIHVEREKRR